MNTRFHAFIIIITLLLACSHNIKTDDFLIKITIPIQTLQEISKEEIKNIFYKTFNKNPYSSNLIEIVIFSYSSGKEIFFFPSNKNSKIKSAIQKGSIEAILKIKHQGELKDIYFIKANGKSMVEMIENLTIEARKVVLSR